MLTENARLAVLTILCTPEHLLQNMKQTHIKRNIRACVMPI
jgi:hypothetical protein